MRVAGRLDVRSDSICMLWEIHSHFIHGQIPNEFSARGHHCMFRKTKGSFFPRWKSKAISCLALLLAHLDYCIFKPVLHNWCNKIMISLGYFIFKPLLHNWCNKIMISLGYFIFKPLLHNWCNKLDSIGVVYFIFNLLLHNWCNKIDSIGVGFFHI